MSLLWLKTTYAAVCYLLKPIDLGTSRIQSLAQSCFSIQPSHSTRSLCHSAC